MLKSRSSYVDLDLHVKSKSRASRAGQAGSREIGSLIVVRPFPSPAKSAGRSCLRKRRADCESQAHSFQFVAGYFDFEIDLLLHIPIAELE